LDPHLLIAYRFGAIFLTEKPPRGAGKPDEALRLLRKGIVANPDYWRLWQDVGFIYYWDLKDYASAARAFQTGSERPGAALWMKVMAAAVAKEGGAVQTSRLLWEQIYREAESASIRQNAEEHLAAFRAQEDLERLNRVARDFAQRHGRAAASWQELIADGMLRGVPRDPLGIPYRIGRDGQITLGPGSKVDLRLLK
jgi:tetratricopeptide (TPR) repeat protein